MTKMQLFYLTVIITSLRMGIEYNLYLLNQLKKNYQLFDFIDLTTFFLCFLFFPFISISAIVFLNDSIQKETPWEFHIAQMKTFDITTLNENKQNQDHLVCWNCESKSDPGSIFCMTCGIKLDLEKTILIQTTEDITDVDD